MTRGNLVLIYKNISTKYGAEDNLPESRKGQRKQRTNHNHFHSFIYSLVKHIHFFLYIGNVLMTIDTISDPAPMSIDA
jgi:hypothetical protein